VGSLLLIALAGFGASFVDGALGMGFGVTSSTLLIAVGLTPALASASVHLAKLGTAAASGAAHYRFGNVDWAGVRRIGIPGAMGAFVGATVLSNISAKAALPFTGTLLFVLGIYIVIRFVRGRAPRRKPGVPGLRLMVPLGLIGGFVDATGGGGWGPVTTPTLMADGRLTPARVIGTVNTAEFIVALAASLGFLVGLGTAGIDLGIVVALLIGGVIAAPIAAYVVRDHLRGPLHHQRTRHHLRRAHRPTRSPGAGERGCHRGPRIGACLRATPSGSPRAVSMTASPATCSPRPTCACPGWPPLT